MSDDTETKAEDEGAGGQMTLIEHLTELRNRLGVALLAFVVLFLVVGRRMMTHHQLDPYWS